jgi:hypothetical protein
MDRSREQMQLSRVDSDDEDRLLQQIRQEAAGKQKKKKKKGEKGGGEIENQTCIIKNEKLAC